MSKRKQIAGTFLILSMVLIMACAPQAAPAPQAPAPAPVAPASAPVAPAKAAWEVEWETTVAAAKKEGAVVLHTTVSAQVRRALTEALKSRFGVSIESVAGGSPELASKIHTQRRAGIYSSDVAIIGSSAPYTILKPAGALERIEPVLFLPELTDPQEIQRVWRLGQLEWVDEAHTMLAFASYVKMPFVVNTDLVKPGEIKAYRDLLNPKWKGRIVMDDPTTGSGIATAAMQVLPHILGWDYMRKLVEQQPVLTRDRRLVVEWVARGKYPIGLFFEESQLKEFLDIGAPLAITDAEEGAYIVGGANVILLIKDAPHPNAAKLFINWLLSKEGQTIYSKAHGAPSGRIDVVTEGMSPEIIPDPKKKYLRTNTEKELLNMPETVKMAREIFGPLKK